ncbi:metal-sensitive transcriptional regulator [Candidatus Roizmanbacteria bacterium]|nr:MAG: metal-sensitive transcriptional regulator [Candidatus Roizmanbacteria bacterium]
MEGLDRRVSRILGQMKGIQKMVKEERDCIEVLQQISAVKKAIDGLTEEIVIQYFNGIIPPDKKEEVKKLIDRTINL